MQKEYEKIIENQLKDGIIEREQEQPRDELLFYMLHESVMKHDATTTRVRVVFDSSVKPYPLANSVN